MKTPLRLFIAALACMVAMPDGQASDVAELFRVSGRDAPIEDLIGNGSIVIGQRFGQGR